MLIMVKELGPSQAKVFDFEQTRGNGKKTARRALSRAEPVL